MTADNLQGRRLERESYLSPQTPADNVESRALVVAGRLSGVKSTIVVDSEGQSRLSFDIGNRQGLKPAEALDAMLHPGVRVETSR